MITHNLRRDNARPIKLNLRSQLIIIQTSPACEVGGHQGDEYDDWSTWV